MAKERETILELLVTEKGEVIRSLKVGSIVRFTEGLFVNLRSCGSSIMGDRIDEGAIGFYAGNSLWVIGEEVIRSNEIFPEDYEELSPGD